MTPSANWFDAAPEQKLDALLKKISCTCTVSESAQKVMALTRAGDVSLTAVVDAVMKDPSLAKELLKIANSPLFGQSRQVHDLKRAVVVVGMQELHNIAAAMSMMAAFATPEPLSNALRGSAVLSAAVARLLARALGGIDEALAFLSGLLAEIGAMACVAVDGREYKQIWDRAKGEFVVRASLEHQRYTACSEDIGFHVLHQSKLPDSVAAAVRRGHGDNDDNLHKLTDFSRKAAPMIIHAANTQDASILTTDIPTLYRSLSLPEIDDKTLIENCIQAATVAELSLRGEASLLDDDNDEKATGTEEAPDDPAAFSVKEIAFAEREERKTLSFEVANMGKSVPVRMGVTGSGGTKKGTVFGVVAVLSLLIIAAAAIVAYYFTTT